MFAGQVQSEKNAATSSRLRSRIAPCGRHLEDLAAEERQDRERDGNEDPDGDVEQQACRDQLGDSRPVILGDVLRDHLHERTAPTPKSSSDAQPAIDVTMRNVP